MPRPEFSSIAVALHFDLVGIVGQSVQGTLGEDGIVEERDPLFHRAVAGEDGGSSAVPFDDDLVDVARLGEIEPPQSEVVHDEQIRGKQTAHDLLARMIGLGLEQFQEHLIGPQKENPIAGATGGMAEATGEQGFPNADGSDEENIFGPLNETEAEQIADPIPVKGDGCIPVEVFQGTDLLEGCSLEPDGEVVLFPTIDFILEHQFQEVLRAQLGLGGIGHPIGKGGQDPREL